MNLFRRNKGGLEKVPIGETVTMLRRYVFEQTVGPLRHIGRTLGFGLAGSLLCGLGAILVLLGFLRLLQGETGNTFSGNWSFAPYLLTTVVAGLMIAGCVVAFLRRGRSS